MRLPFFVWSIAGVPLSQALPGFLITAPPPVLVPAVLGALAVWIQNPPKKKSNAEEGRDSDRSGPGRWHGLLMHAQNRITIPCGKVEARLAVHSGALMRAILGHLQQA